MAISNLHPTSHVTLRAMLDGYRSSQVISVAAQLGIADLLAGGTQHYEEIARQTRTHATTLRRLLRALVSLGVLAQTADGNRFSLTALGEPLRSSAPESLRAWAVVSATHFECWSGLRHSVESGETAFDHIHGMDVWAFRKANPEAGRVFNEAMAANTVSVAAAVVDAAGFSRFDTLVDVGAGKGALVQAILRACPASRAVLLDSPEALGEAEASLKHARLADRCQFVPGSFFESIPPNGKAYTLSRILHDWNDGTCIQILTNIRHAMAFDGTLFIIERALDEGNPSIEVTQSDLHMLVMTGGCERTVKEFSALLDASGLSLVRAVPTGSAMTVIEAVPV